MKKILIQKFHQVPKSIRYAQYLCKPCFRNLEISSELKKSALESHFLLKSFDEPNYVAELEDFSEDQSDFKGESSFADYTVSEIFEEEPESQLITKPKRNLYNKPRPRAKKPKSEFFECDLCKKSIKKSSKAYHIQYHKKKQDAMEEKTCENCHKTFLFQEDFNKHNCVDAFKNCESCGIIFDTVDSYKIHLKDYHFDGDVYHCPEPDCGSKELTSGCAYYHIKWHKFPELMHFECEECGKTFTDPRRFNVHKSRHFKTSSYTCDLCGTNISAKENLYRHMRKHLKVKFYCDECPKVYSDKMLLKDHKMKAHGMEAPYRCAHCSKPFLFLSMCKKHESKKFCGQWVSFWAILSDFV